MQIPIPAIRPFYSREELAALSPAQGLAALFGVPKSYLSLVDEADAAGFRKHPFKSMHIPNENNMKLSFGPSEQDSNIDYLLSGPLFSSPASLVVVNSYPYYYSPQYGEGFLYRLACAIAAKRISAKDTHLEFSHLGTVEVEQYKWVDPKPRHVFSWGPITDDFVNFMYVHAGRFLSSYLNHTRILLCCVKDVSPVLIRLGVDISHPDFIFSLGPQTGKELPSEVPKWARIHKARQQKVVAI